MSKFVKDLMTDDLRSRWNGVEEALLVNVVGMEAEASVALRKQLREKHMHLMVVKKSLALRATEGTALAAAFEGAEGAMALVWGGDDIVSLAKEVTSIAKADVYKPFTPLGGVLDGAHLSADEVQQVSKWPSRTELISIVAGQIMSVPSQIASQLTGPATDIAAQVKTLIERQEEGETPAAQ
ncbi:50S ribosomal protein L10 [Pirellulimonas nuda]|uniref:Large ribosomal subunit protein uL10 n=1 Tax=Pirellulimonas nuda TaxID=2528009 RepID=A0A518DIX1_9BACT|nr:50S ribosomal protein L10 [Pirellulimonas nuda]QDU91431.1 50S ribosomal protein L10 [Pirellulimonas nuda]